MPRPKREHGTGTALKRVDGYWTCKVTVGGKRRTVRRKSREEARTKRDEHLAEARRLQEEAALTEAERRSVAQYLRWWATRHKRYPQVSRATERFHRQNIENYLVPHVGDVRLQSLTTDHILEMMARLAVQRVKRGAGKPLSSRTRTGVLVTLKAALADAVRAVPPTLASNPAHPVKPPKKDPLKPVRAVPASGWPKLKEQCENSEYGPIVLFLIGAGPRVSEGIALCDDLLDLAGPSPTAQILRKLEWLERELEEDGQWRRDDRGQIVPARWCFEDVKRPKSRRTLPLGPLALEGVMMALERRTVHRALREGRGLPWEDEGSGLVFTTCTGRPLIPRNVQRALTMMLREAGLADVGLHQLRKTHGTELLRRGANLAVVRDLLGHEDIRTTALYLEAVPEDQREAVARIVIA